jgi:predicted PurR-regulated permease PerM
MFLNCLEPYINIIKEQILARGANILKPLIISHIINLLFILILLGVLGGVIAFGFIGIFLGPALIALGYSLIFEWTCSKDASEKPEESSP